MTPGLVACNPPYDERLAADPALYRALGAALKRGFVGWQAAILAAADSPYKAIGLKPSRSIARPSR